MELSFLWRTSEFRGDHSADVAIAVKPDPDETIERFAARILGASLNAYNGQSSDTIEIRAVAEKYNANTI